MHLFLTKVAFIHKHCKRQWFTQPIYLHVTLNISKHYLVRNGAHLPTVCLACWNFAPHCMKLLGSLTNWPTALDWCLASYFYNCFHITIKTWQHCSSEACFFPITLLNFAQLAYLIQVACKNEKRCNIKFLQPA